MLPPGIPDFFSRSRIVDAGRVKLFGRAWSGGGVPITRVEVGVDGVWSDARLQPEAGQWAWRGWFSEWDATPGEHVLACRATDAQGNVQPVEPVWDVTGFGNNAAQRVHATVRG